MSDVSRIQPAIEQGEPQASDELLPLIYNELRRLAAAHLSEEKPGQTLQATALVHEAYLRLVDTESPQEWCGRGHFFAAAAEAMRRILVEKARRKGRIKHGGEFRRLDSDELQFVADRSEEELLSVDQVLSEFAALDAQASEIVKLHFFAGLALDEVASVLGISARTVYRDWAFARAWLARRLKG